MAAVAARSLFRSTASAARIPRSRPVPSPFRLASQKPLAARIFRSPVEMCSVSVVSMFPHHTATASALLTSMLPRAQGWSIQDPSDDC